MAWLGGWLLVLWSLALWNSNGDNEGDSAGEKDEAENKDCCSYRHRGVVIACRSGNCLPSTLVAKTVVPTH